MRFIAYIFAIPIALLATICMAWALSIFFLGPIWAPLVIIADNPDWSIPARIGFFLACQVPGALFVLVAWLDDVRGIVDMEFLMDRVMPMGIAQICGLTILGVIFLT